LRLIFTLDGVEDDEVSYFPSQDRIWRNLSYFLHLLIGLGFVFSQAIGRGRRPIAKGLVWALVAIESHLFSDACPCFRAGLQGMQIDAFVFQRKRCASPVVSV